MSKELETTVQIERKYIEKLVALSQDLYSYSDDSTVHQLKGFIEALALMFDIPLPEKKG